MALKNLLKRMETAGFELPKKKHSLHEARVSVNPKTRTMMFQDANGRLWSDDPRECHFDVLSRDRTYMRIAYDGSVLGQKNSTLAYVH